MELAKKTFRIIILFMPDLKLRLKVGEKSIFFHFHDVTAQGAILITWVFFKKCIAYCSYIAENNKNPCDLVVKWNNHGQKVKKFSVRKNEQIFK